MSEKIRNRIQFIEELKTLKEKADAEGIIFLITDAVSRSICDMDELAKVLGMETKRGRRGTKVWKIADFVRANIADINIDAIVIDEEELNFPVSEVFVDETIVPSDNLESRIIKGSGADYVPAALVSREQYLLEVLKELKIEGDCVERWHGKNFPEMMRKESYSLWKIPELEKMVLVCDEEGNRTFVINECRAPKKYIRRTKSELKQMENVKNFIWTDVGSWKEKLKECLIYFERVKSESNGSLTEITPIGNEHLPRVNENNEIVDKEGKIYLTITTLVSLEEVCTTDRKKIRRIIKENNIQSIKGKDVTGNERDFYPIEEVKRYTNVNEHLPCANENNEIVIERERYLTVSALSRLEDVRASDPTIKKIIKENNIQSIKAVDKIGHEREFYPIEEVKKYTNVNKHLPRANENNEIVIEGERYLNINSLACLKEVCASVTKIIKIIKENNIQSIKAVDKIGHEREFYPIEEVKKYTNVNKHLPCANQNNEIVIESERYLTLRALDRLEEVRANEHIIEKIIKENNIQSIKGKDKIGHERDFYPIEEVKSYTNVNEHLPCANENNEIVIEGERYLTISALGRLEEVYASTRTIEKIIKENNIQIIKGKSKSGRVLHFYSIEDVKKYTNINEHLPRVNENNEIVIEGKRYLTIEALNSVEEVCASYKTIRKIIKENNILGIKGKDKTCKVCDFYPIEEVKKYTNV